MGLKFWMVGAVLSLGLVAPVSGAGIVDVSNMSWSSWDVAAEPSRDLDLALALPAPRIEQVAYAEPVIAPEPAAPVEPVAVQVVAENETMTDDVIAPLDLLPVVPHPRPVRFKVHPKLTAAVQVKEEAPAPVRKFDMTRLWLIGAYR